MTKIALTGPQIIHSALMGKSTEVEVGVCRMCGGSLLAPSKPASSRSETWTDENLCLRRDSTRFCSPCGWFIEGNNRMNFWQSKSALFVSEIANHATTANNILKILESNFPIPSVFLLKGGDPQLSRKHQEWRTMQAVTHSRKKTHIAFAGLQRFKDTKISGVAIVDADRFTALVRNMITLSTTYILPILEHRKTNWARQNDIFTYILDGITQNISQETYLAAYIASMVTVYGEE